ncbi:dTDP-4-dehydrorhamnose reductase [Fusobacterium polymorphum]|uniref:dTDP-4-dehydrorhamnose reductase n=1 Tax=Fusobacterium nucleatum subsp. polymorphum TaxID=76857 RepID=UPI002B4BBB07|nr:dTDP-4-dehydrorhamnose reductase [Fusobacterium polymorphum]WRL74175.1 dTDP-4-dehydrorhamnose reductase [Fusobacterium polymorphum]
MKLIFGANGKLGTDFKELFDSMGEKYIATDKNEVDITNGDFLRAYIKTMHQNYKIDTIINCAAYNDVDKAETEKELCYKVNAEAPANLAMIASEIGATYITYSTDFVFDGMMTNYLYNESTGYTEEDEPHPLSAYAKAKYEGELLISQIMENPENTSRIYIVRTSWVFGKGSMNFVEKIIELSKEKDELKVVEDQVSSPTYSKDLAYFSCELIKKGCESGIYHLTNDGIASKYEEAQYILEKISWKGNLIRAKREELGLLAERPKFSKLSCKKIKEKLGVSIPNWKDAIDRYFKENNK